MPLPDRDTAMETDVCSTAEPLFRPVKRRKFLRRRADGEQEDRQDGNKATGQKNDNSHHRSISCSSQEEDDAAPTTGVIRLRRQYKPRRGGIEFSTTSRQPAEGQTQSAVDTTTAEDADDTKIRSMCDRFTAHTGQKVDVDKHMMDYIESEMARRHRLNLPPDTSGADATPGDEAIGGPSSGSKFTQREPATLGKLHEIDLGRETKIQNIARTEAATRKLARVNTPAVDPDSRDRKGRNNDDVERDRLVEEVLRESKLDVYDELPQEEEQQDDLAADDKIADQFRREFIDAIQSRRRFARARHTNNNKTKAKKPDIPRGPKLGGSRSARAAMRERQSQK